MLHQFLDDDLAQHLTYQQLEDLVDERLSADERAVAEAHASHCRACRANLMHLRAIAVEVRGVERGEAPRIARTPKLEARTWFAGAFDVLPSVFSPASALAAVALVLAATSGWLGIRLREEQQATAEQARLLSAERQAAQADIARLQRELQEQAKTPTPVTPPNSIVAFALAPGVFRAGNAARLELPAGVSAVRLTLSTDLEPRARSFQAVLRLATGREVWRTAWLSASDRPAATVEVVIPEALLTPDQYILEWSAEQASNRFEPIEDYAFTIVRQQ